MERLVSRIRAGWENARAGGESCIWWETPVSALEQDLSSETPEEVINEDGASEEGLWVVNESHLLQGETQHVGALLQHWRNLNDNIPLHPSNLVNYLKETGMLIQ